MKKMLIGLLALGTFSAFADQYRCESEKGEILLSVTDNKINLNLNSYEQHTGSLPASFYYREIDLKNIPIAKVPRKYKKQGVSVENKSRSISIYAFTWDGGLGSLNLKIKLNKVSKEMKVKFYHEAYYIKHRISQDKLSCESLNL